MRGGNFFGFFQRSQILTLIFFKIQIFMPKYLKGANLSYFSLFSCHFWPMQPILRTKSAKFCGHISTFDHKFLTKNRGKIRMFPLTEAKKNKGFWPKHLPQNLQSTLAVLFCIFIAHLFVSQKILIEIKSMLLVSRILKYT